MGNKLGSEFGGIMIRTEKSSYFAGDIVKENIYLHFIKPGYHGNIFQFSLVDETQLLDNLYFLLNYIYPPIYLDLFITEMASLKYKVKARLISTSKSINDIKYKLEIIIREPIKNIFQVSSKQETANLTTWCCKQQGVEINIIKGFINFSQVEKNLYFPGEFVQRTYNIDNSNCKLNIENVEVIIVNELKIRTSPDNQYFLEFQLNALSHNGIQKGMKIQPSQSIGCSLQLINSQQPQQALTPSTKGNFVNSIYYVKNIPNFEGIIPKIKYCICCSSNFIAQVPITILAVLPQDYLQSIVQSDNQQPEAFQRLIIKSNSVNRVNYNNNIDDKSYEQLIKIYDLSLFYNSKAELQLRFCFLNNFYKLLIHKYQRKFIFFIKKLRRAFTHTFLSPLITISL